MLSMSQVAGALFSQMDHRRKQRSVFMALHSVKSLDSLNRKDA